MEYPPYQFYQKKGNTSKLSAEATIERKFRFLRLDNLEFLSGDELESVEKIEVRSNGNLLKSYSSDLLRNSEKCLLFELDPKVELPILLYNSITIVLIPSNSEIEFEAKLHCQYEERKEEDIFSVSEIKDFISLWTKKQFSQFAFKIVDKVFNENCVPLERTIWFDKMIEKFEIAIENNYMNLKEAANDPKYGAIIAGKVYVEIANSANNGQLKI